MAGQETEESILIAVISSRATIAEGSVPVSSMKHKLVQSTSNCMHNSHASSYLRGHWIFVLKLMYLQKLGNACLFLTWIFFFVVLFWVGHN